jgi:hypothetical protein
MEILKAISLLREKGPKALTGIGGHDESTCPIAKTYGVLAAEQWMFLEEVSVRTLIDAGWMPQIYNAFIRFYDHIDLRNSEYHNENVVRSLLAA